VILLAKKKTFEESLARLEEIVTAMESTETGLEESVKLYTEGVELARVCSERLNEAQQSVKILREKADGSFVKDKFEPLEAEEG
jgi:exodeoxyribonuclease VII small subunit